MKPALALTITLACCAPDGADDTPTTTNSTEGPETSAVMTGKPAAPATTAASTSDASSTSSTGPTMTDSTAMGTASETTTGPVAPCLIECEDDSDCADDTYNSRNKCIYIFADIGASHKKDHAYCFATCTHFWGCEVGECNIPDAGEMDLCRLDDGVPEACYDAGCHCARDVDCYGIGPKCDGSRCVDKAGGLITDCP